MQGHTSRKCSHQYLNPGLAASTACFLPGGPSSQAAWYVRRGTVFTPRVYCGHFYRIQNRVLGCSSTVRLQWKFLNAYFLYSSQTSSGPWAVLPSNIPLHPVGTQRGPSGNTSSVEWVARYIKVTLGEAHDQGLCTLGVQAQLLTAAFCAPYPGQHGLGEGRPA